jgi:tetratricopeptide (TPR) repeat protein
MKCYSFLPTMLALVCIATIAAPGHCDDKVYKKGGKEVSGSIDQITSSGIAMVSGAKVLSSNVEYVRYDREPPQLSSVRGLTKKGDYAEALAEINGLEAPSRLALIEDIAYRKAYCLFQLSMPRDLNAKKIAITALTNFIGKHPSSFYFYDANRAIGDIFVVAGYPAKALPYYKTLANSRIQAYQLAGKLAMADVLYGENDFAKAKAAYESIMNIAPVDAVSRTYALQGKLGYAACLAGMKESAKALAITEDVIKKADPAAEELHARAYNTLGKCYLVSDRKDAKKQALRAFLIVDIVYSAYPEQHAEALYRLQDLWAEIGERGNANESRARLEQQYPGSTWARRKSTK